MLLRHLRVLIGPGKVRDKPVLSTTWPQGFGTVGQLEQQQEQFPSMGRASPDRVPHRGGPGAAVALLVTHEEARHPLLPSRRPRSSALRNLWIFPGHDITFPLTLQQQHLCHRITGGEAAVQGTNRSNPTQSPDTG